MDDERLSTALYIFRCEIRHQADKVERMFDLAPLTTDDDPALF